MNTYISPCYAWLGTALRQRVEQTDRRAGRLLRQRVALARKAIIKAARVARGFPADRAHCLREIGLLEAIRGNLGKSARYLNFSLASARQHDQSAEEWETLGCLLALHKLDPEALGAVPPAQQDRYTKLCETYCDDSRQDRAAGNRSSNLSLADRFVTVLQSGRRIAQALSADVVYKEASEASRKLLRGQNVDVVLIDEVDQALSLMPDTNAETDESARNRVQVHESLIRAAYAEGQALHNGSAGTSRQKTGSAIAAPIAFRGTNVAVILVTHDELNNLFRADEQRIADFVSTLAGAALENADGFLQLRQLNDTLEQRVLERTQAAEQRARQLATSNQQLRETEDQLREAIVHANAANEAKGRFLATISHEIRTPLNGILGMNRLAQQASEEARRTNYLETVQESGESLLILINDLLDVSKLESGKLELEQIELNPRTIADEICKLMSASATQSSVDLNWEIASSVPAVVLGDPSRIRQIVMNLIGNAIKFTEQGFVKLDINFAQAADGSNWLTIVVKDSGIGIPADKIDSVFDSFSQVDSSTTRRYGGTGLGLAICRELAEMMGGSISLTSELGVGSEFTVRLPVELGDTQDAVPSTAIGEPSNTEPMEQAAVPTDAQTCSPMRILVAEDGAINQEVIVGMLELNGYEVVVANNGEEAYQKASEESFDLCLMDVDMPKMDGIEATRMIRDTLPDVDRDSLPIIAMTAHCGDQIWSKCEAAGMNAYVPKPINPKTLFENIERFSGPFDLTRGDRSAAPSPEHCFWTGYCT